MRQAKVLFNIEILGVNAATANVDSYIQLISLGNPLPWLQDTPTHRVWETWGVTYRDLRILDSSNRVTAVFNLTAHDLGDSENYDTAKALFLAAANAGDANRNGLPDQWESKYFGNNLADRDADPDHDGYSNFLEFAFGTDPLDPNSHPALPLLFNVNGQGTVTFTRWAGSTSDYLVDASTNLTAWITTGSVIRGATTNLFDGTGRLRSIFTLTKPANIQTNGFIRLRLQARP